MRGYFLIGSMIVLTLACGTVGMPATARTDAPTATGEFPGANTSSTTPLASVPTETPGLPVDLLLALQNAMVQVKGRNRADQHVDLLIQNKTDTTLWIESPAGLVLGDDDAVTVDLVLPSISALEIPPKAEMTISIPAYQASFTYQYRLRDPDAEVYVKDFINPAPAFDAALAVVRMEARLGAVLEAADLGEAATYDPTAQLAVLAIASDIRARTVGFCGSDVVYRGNIMQGDTIFWFVCYNSSTGLGSPTASPGAFGSSSEDLGMAGDIVQRARDTLRKSAALDAELATPFHIAFQSTSPAFSDEEIRTALVGLIQQERIIENFGFGVTFHLVESQPLPDEGVVSLPEISKGGMSQSEALTVIRTWSAENGPLEFRLMIEASDPMSMLAQLLAEDWQQAGVSAEIFVAESAMFYRDFFAGNFDDAAIQHRPGLLP